MLSAVYIKGFKTFARPVRMPLEDGVTVIVGPNGSGKSNITDAVLFALGEQSPGVLRAGTMSDLIFSGSETLPAAAAAEVTLVLDNASGEFSLPYEEVSISRRISRDGETEYRINGSRSRLADVGAVAGEAGIGRHSILRQGAVDAIVAGGAAACRLALEEAAGLGVYRRRRLAASRRLERADAQLEKSRQLEAELADQLRRIQSEAVAAREYRELEARHRKLSLAYLYRLATRDLEDRRAELKTRDARLSELVAQEESLREKQAGIEPELRRIESVLRDRERTLEALEDVAESLRAESLRADRAVFRVESDRFREQQRTRMFSQLEGELRRVEEVLSDLERRDDLLEKEHRRVSQDVDRREAALSQAKKENDEVGGRIARLTGELERLRARRDRSGNSDEAESSLSAESFDRLSEVATARDPMPDEDSRARLDSLLALARTHRKTVGIYAADVSKRRGALAAARGSIEARIRSLETTRGNGDSGTRLYEVIRARAGFETAVEAALGEVGEGILAQDLDQSVRILSRTERVVVRLDAREVEEDADQPGRPLLECVEIVDPRYRDAVSRILGGIYVVEAPAKTAPANGHVTVTRDGMRLTRTSVSLSNGDGRFEREALLSLERQRLDRLDKDSAEILRGLEETISRASELAETLATETEGTLAIAARAGRASASLIREASRRRERAERARDLSERCREQSEALEREISITEANLRETRKSSGSAKEKLASASSVAEAARAELQEIETQRARTRAEISEGEVRKRRISKTLERRYESSADEDARVVRAAERTARVAGTIAERLLERRNRMREARSQASETHRRLTGDQNRLASRAAELAGELARARVEADRLREELAQAESAAETAPAALETERNRIARKIKRFGDVNLLALSQESELRERHEFVAAQRSDAEDATAELNRIIHNVNREIETRFARTFERARDAFRAMIPKMMSGASGDLDVSEEGVEIGLRLGRRGSRPLNVLSGGERALLALSFLFSIFLSSRGDSGRTFCVLDEAEAALDDPNLARFLSVVDSHRANGQFLLVTHQKRTMAAADILYGVTQDASGATAVVSKRLAGE